MMNVCLGTVVYDLAFKYHKEFIEAINSQTDKEFDVVIVNDNLSQDQIEVYKSGIKNNLIILDNLGTRTISSMRVSLLEGALSYKYDFIILADADDSFSEDRVLLLKKAYQSNHTFYYNDLCDFSKKPLLKNLPTHMDTPDKILECNFLGLSNTAINLRRLSLIYLKKMKSINTNIFDWYLYSKLLIDGHMGKYVETAKTFYRTHNDNIAGISLNNHEAIKREIDIKIKHYELLRDNSKEINNLYNAYIGLKDLPPNILENYIDNNNSYWWGFIKIKNKR